MAIPLGYWQGNVSEYIAGLALIELGFTVPVPRQEDHFGIDFILHLASLEDKTVLPTGRSLGIQVKSNKEAIVLSKSHQKACLFDSSLPFFLGVVSRNEDTIEVYNTLRRTEAYWLYGKERPVTLVFEEVRGMSIPKIRLAGDGTVVIPTGPPILRLEGAAHDRPGIERLRKVVRGWIDLDSFNLSLKEQQIPLFYWPTQYRTNDEILGQEQMSYTKAASLESLPNVLQAAHRVLTALSFYVRRLPEEMPPGDHLANTMRATVPKVEDLEGACQQLLDALHVQ